MLSALFKLVSLPVVLILLIFNLRRILFALTILLMRPRRKEQKQNDFLPDVLILVPCRDEEDVIGDSAQSLAELDYPKDRYRVILIDDGSSDLTRYIMEAVAKEQPNFALFSLPGTLGKARALNAALDHFSYGEIIYVFDADHRPAPGAVRTAVEYFRDPEVAGVSGQVIASNALATPAAYYASVESMVHQLVTMRAKDRLGLAPALLGSNCAYRRRALENVGGFRAGAFLEDTDLTVRFYRAGYRIRFAADSHSLHRVPATVRGYIRQHTRWARGFNDVALEQAGTLVEDRALSLPLRAELFLFSTGYLDRLALLAAGGLTMLSLLAPRRFSFPRRVLALALLTPLAQIVALFVNQRVSAAMWLRLPLVPVFFVIDILAAVRAMADSIANRRRVWGKTERG